MSWRLLFTEPLGGAENMAVDEVLLESAIATGRRTVRVYSWRTPTVSFGRNQRVAGRFERVAFSAGGLDVVRRITGGRALLHSREITYSVASPVRDSALRGDYDLITGLLLRALRALGVNAAEAKAASRRNLDQKRSRRDLICFESPSRGELVVGGDKLSGSAQLRLAGAFLQHGSILIDDDQNLLAEAMPDARTLPARPAATLRAALGRSIEPGEFASVLFREVRRSWDDSATEAELDPGELRRVGELVHRYEDAGWTWEGAEPVEPRS
ncbi:MAG: lipoate--protein ligase family protein [Gemmatimonadota bacterium]